MFNTNPLSRRSVLTGLLAAAIYEDHRFARERNEDTPEIWFRRQIIELA